MEEFKLIREHLVENPQANATDLAEATGVDIQHIMRFIKQGSLRMRGARSCERCGAAILQGQYCDRCAAELRGQMSGAARRLKPEGGSYFSRRRD